MLLPAKEGADADYRPPCGRGGPADPDASREDAGRVPASDRESAPESVGTSPGRVDVVDQLRGLGELQTAGVISEEEFETAKRQLLARL